MCVNEDGTIDYNLHIRRKNELGYEALKEFVSRRADVLSYRSNLQYNHIK